ncbi:MAG: hypothetical protein IJ875_05165 [Solobacterium sp.]|nr:hypothetical protein [Solobacterium sp.]
MNKKRNIHALHLTQFLTLIIFLFFIFLFTIVNLFAPKLSFSANENRPLASFPNSSLQNIFFGSFDTEFEKWFSDHFVGRDHWIEMKANTRLDLSAIENNGVYIGKDGHLISQFYDYDLTTKENNISFVLDFAKQNNIKMNILLVPGAAYGEEKYLPFGAYNINEKELIDSIYEDFNNNGQKTIDISDALKNSEDSYFKTDHHYNHKGAYIAYQAICDEVLKKEALNFNYTEVSPTFYGTMYSRSGIFSTKPDAIYEMKATPLEVEVSYDDGTVTHSLFAEEKLKEKDKYTYYLGGNHAYVHIKTNANTKKKAIVIKDSFAHILLPYLAYEYDEIHVFDLRYYREAISKTLEKNMDVYLIYGVETFVTDPGLAGLW